MFVTKKSLLKRVNAVVEPELEEWKKHFEWCNEVNNTPYRCLWAVTQIQFHVRDSLKHPKGKWEYKFIIGVGPQQWAITKAQLYIENKIKGGYITGDLADEMHVVYTWLCNRLAWLGKITDDEATKMSDELWDIILDIRYPKDDD